ncbi:MAG: metallophosphoesterase family protein [Candidatus Dormibacteraceae bacterium]
MVRIAAAADVHFGLDSEGRLGRHLEGIAERADLLLIAGDLTRSGDPAEAAVLAADLGRLPIPVVAVLGNHDHHQDRAAEIVRIMVAAGVRVLEGDCAVLAVAGTRVGVAGVKGFGGGFAGACGTEFGERQMKAFVGHGRELAESLAVALAPLAGTVDVRIALTHYAPVRGTLVGEPLEIYPFLGSYMLGQVIDQSAVSIAFHGHAHAGTERATTPGGVPVRNVAQPVIRHPFNLYEVGEGTGEARSRPAERFHWEGPLESLA